MWDKPPIYEYDNFRNYLKEVYGRAKARGRKYSLRYFSRLLGFSSPSFFKLVMDGKRNLSDGSIDRFVEVLKLNSQEARYFRSLVALNQAKTSDERVHYSREILRSKSYRQTHPLSEAQLEYFTHWYYIVIRELVNLPAFKEDPKWIADNTLPPVSVKQAEDALAALQRLGLIGRDAQGRLVQAKAVVSTGDEVISACLAEYHKQFMIRARESIDLIRREMRDISSVTFPANEKTAKSIKAKIQKFRNELAQEAAGDPRSSVVYQLNMQLFPVTQFCEPNSESGEET
jgi:uncharacterized protein (TIGR02147 family)